MLRAGFAILMAAGLIMGLDAGALAQGAPRRIVALGDSLSAGYLLPAKDAFPNQLEGILRARGLDVRVENAGVSGDTSSGGLARLDWSVGEGVEAVILELGANDALRAVDPAITESALDQMLGKLKARGIKVLLAGMYAPRNNGESYVSRFDAIYPRLSQKHGVSLYPFFLEGVQGEKSLVLSDGLHPNAAGVRVIAEKIAPMVEKLLSDK
jgi:acyl-CoA thioesterase-1